jgi:hypothetical protein
MGYGIVNSTARGKVLLTEKPNVTGVQAVITSSLSDLSNYFGSKPKVTNAVEDQANHVFGAANFTVTSHSRMYKGFILSRLKSGSAKVLVAFSQKDTPRAEWARLLGISPPSAATTKGTSPGIAGASHGSSTTINSNGASSTPGGLKPYNFPDGNGFIGLAAGWTSAAPSCQSSFAVTGPSDQKISMNFSQRVITPGAAIPGSPFPVAPFMNPRQAFAYIMPLLSRLSVGQGGPAYAFDHVEERRDLPKLIPRGPNSTVLAYGVTETARGGSQKRYLAVATVSTVPSQGGWMYYMEELRAQETTFQRDLPTMLSMAQSWRIYKDVTERRGAAQLAQQRQENEAQQRRAKAQAEANYESTRRWEESQKQKYSHSGNAPSGGAYGASSNQATLDDFSEYIRGNRTVEDTRTGVKGSVDLGNVDQIVDQLNTFDPGRFRQIPLRDENW